MSRSPELYQWRAEIARRFPRLSQPMVMGLALWSLGMILVRSCSLTAIADGWSCRLGQPFQTVRERLRDTYREADAKAGAHRRQLELEACWVPWLHWVLDGGSGTQLAVALDATTLGQRWVVLVISVVYRGCAVPVGWKVLPAGIKHPWRPKWLALLKHLRGRVSPTWTVIVLADRGLYAKWLFEGIQDLGWHPLLRVNLGGSFRPAGWYHWVPFRQLVPAVGHRWQGAGTAFTHPKTRLRCTLLGRWEAGHEAPWLILTNVPPQAADACWYGLRAWIEQGFKRIKRGGWQWQSTRMTDPARVERLWLAIAIATWWVLAVGGEAEAAIPAATFPTVPGSPRQQDRRWRLVGIFRHGWSLIVAALFNHQPLPLGHGCPEPWPAVPISPDSLLITSARR
ncbi:MAG: transposase [Candidatus Competibacteraceae bacterium]